MLAIDCAGGQRIYHPAAHRAWRAAWSVAPASFGRYGGDLDRPRTKATGRVYAVAPDGRVSTLVQSGLPHGGDIGAESTGFVPPGFTSGDAAYLADRYSSRQPAPGDEQHPAGCPGPNWPGPGSARVTCWARNPRAAP